MKKGTKGGPIAAQGKGKVEVEGPGEDKKVKSPSSTKGEIKVKMSTAEIRAQVTPFKPLPEGLWEKLTPGQKRYWGIQRPEREKREAAKAKEKK